MTQASLRQPGDRDLREGDNMLRGQALKRIGKKAKKGFRGFPVATIAFYGPNHARATKIAVGITMAEDQETAGLRRWASEEVDVRVNPTVAVEVLSFIERFGVKSVVMTDRIIGCPHEEGIDYDGPKCPFCPYWAGRDRWTGELSH
jgi:hypothetical protein